MIFGIDTASVAKNTNVSWTTAKAQGPIGFALLRAAWGTSPDEFFLAEWDRVKSAGLVAGAYMYLRFRTEKYGAAPPPVEQAQSFVEVVDGRLEANKDFPPTIDVEFPNGRGETGLTAAQLLEGIHAAWSVLADHYQTPPIIYTSARVWREDLDDLAAPDLIATPPWLVGWLSRGGEAVRDPARVAKISPHVPSGWGDSQSWVLHQYQGSATGLPGFPTGNVDMNRFHVASKGDAGGHVSWIQRRLGLSATGLFDDVTESGVRALQKSAGLVVDGVVGPRTFVRLAWPSTQVADLAEQSAA
jgi:GH25 family lysozyme M1 (1,4-beta-N-acetylmuramidase)